MPRQIGRGPDAHLLFACAGLVVYLTRRGESVLLLVFLSLQVVRAGVEPVVGVGQDPGRGEGEHQ